MVKLIMKAIMSNLLRVDNLLSTLLQIEGCIIEKFGKRRNWNT